MFRFTIAALAVVGLVSAITGGVGPGFGLLWLIPLFFFGKLLFWGAYAGWGPGHRHRDGRDWLDRQTRASSGFDPTATQHRREEFEEWHRLSHAREEVDSWTTEFE